jgi:hypothetical protein
MKYLDRGGEQRENGESSDQLWQTAGRQKSNASAAV